MKNLFKSEKGMVIVEATIVFPVIFFILFFLLYMGNMYYMRSQVDQVVAEAAVRGAAAIADPILEEIQNNDHVPIEIGAGNMQIKPYRYLFSQKNVELNIKNEVEESIQKLGNGFYQGMYPRNVQVQTGFHGRILLNSFEVNADFELKFPIKFMGNDEPVILKFNSRSVVPVTETDEFIRNVDMAVDYMQSSGLEKKLSKAFDKVKEFFSISGNFKD